MEDIAKTILLTPVESCAILGEHSDDIALAPKSFDKLKQFPEDNSSPRISALIRIEGLNANLFSSHTDKAYGLGICNARRDTIRVETATSMMPQLSQTPRERSASVVDREDK